VIKLSYGTNNRNGGYGGRSRRGNKATFRMVSKTMDAGQQIRQVKHEAIKRHVPMKIVNNLKEAEKSTSDAIFDMVNDGVSK
jgi:hypothetical protein